MQETRVQSLAWKIPWRRKWQPTPVFLPGKIPWTTWWAVVHGVAKSQTWLNDWAHRKENTHLYKSLPRNTQPTTGLSRIQTIRSTEIPSFVSVLVCHWFSPGFFSILNPLIGTYIYDYPFVATGWIVFPSGNLSKAGPSKNGM